MSDQESNNAGMSGFKPFLIIFAVLAVALVLIKLLLSAIM